MIRQTLDLWWVLQGNGREHVMEQTAYLMARIKKKRKGPGSHSPLQWTPLVT